MAKLQQYDGAEQNFSKAIQQNPDFAEAYFNLAVLYAKGRRAQETITNLQNAIRINPEYVEAHFYLAQVYLATNNSQGLAREYEILRNLDPATAERLQQLMKKQN
jgi:tetratricopeptide (TPR) repeat protein